MNNTIVNFIQRRRLTAAVLTIAFAFGFLIAGPASVADAAWPMGAYEIVITNEANARTEAGGCSEDEGWPPDYICGETCLITMEGATIPQGIFHCVPR